MLPLGFASFLCFGLVLVLVGANQASLAQDLDLNFERTGLLGSLLGLGLGLGVVSAGPLFDRYSRRGLFIGSVLISAVALLSVDASGGFSRLALQIVLVGFGIGAYDTILNAAVIESAAERSPRTLSGVHAAATLGAMAGPPLVSVFFADDWSASFRLTGATHLVLAFWALFVDFPAPAHTRKRLWNSESRAFWRSLLPFAAVAFAYVGIEATLTVFAVPYASQSGQGEGSGRLAISAFWFGLLVGRVAALARGRIPTARGVMRAGLLASVLLGGGIALALPRIELVFVVVGLALGTVYPVMVALVGRHHPHAPGSATGLAAGAGAVGGFAVPWLTGILADATHLKLALGTLALWSLLIAAGAAGARSGKPR